MKSLRAIITPALALAIATFTGDVPASAAKAQSDAQIEAQCRPFFHKACSEAMGRWLSEFGPDFRALWDNATHVVRHDDFAYEGEHTDPKFVDGSNGPHDGTFFVFGLAGPPKGHAVYDRAHCVAFFDEGCCSLHRTVLVSEAGPPPKYVVTRDLSSLATFGGARLGMSETRILSLYGPAKRLAVPEHSGLYVRAYTTFAPRNAPIKRVPYAGCGQTEVFYFRDERLTAIALWNGC